MRQAKALLFCFPAFLSAGDNGSRLQACSAVSAKVRCVLVFGSAFWAVNHLPMPLNVQLLSSANKLCHLEVRCRGQFIIEGFAGVSVYLSPCSQRSVKSVSLEVVIRQSHRTTTTKNARFSREVAVHSDFAPTTTTSWRLRQPSLRVPVMVEEETIAASVSLFFWCHRRMIC